MNYIGQLKEFLNLEPLEQLPEESTITLEQYKELLKTWLPTQGENVGKGLFGKWAWQAGREDHFKTELYSLGVRIIHDENLPPSDTN